MANSNLPPLIPEEQRQPMFDRHFFNTAINLGVIAPFKLDASHLVQQIEVMIANYLSDHFKVTKIALPDRPGMPGGEFIYELRDKMEDIR